MHHTFLIGTARKGEIPGWEAAGKTGTSQEFRDAWFVGFTGSLVAGVWLGNDNGDPTKRVSGGNLPVEVWQGFMKTALKGQQPVPLPGGGWRGQPEDTPMASAAPPVGPFASADPSPGQSPAPQRRERNFLERLFGL